MYLIVISRFLKYPQIFGNRFTRFLIESVRTENRSDRIKIWSGMVSTIRLSNDSQPWIILVFKNN